MEILISIFLMLIAFGASLWALRVIAGVLGAGNNSWGACALAMIVPAIAGAIIAVAFGFAGLHPLIGAVVAFIIQIWLIAKFLETGVLRAFVISLVASIVAVVILVGGFFVLGMVFGVGLMGLMGIAMMGSEMGGQPGTMSFPDQQPQTVIIEQGSTQPSLETESIQPSPDSAGGGDSATSSEETVEEPVEQATEPEPTETKRVKYGFQEIDVSLVQGYLNGPIKLQLKDGRVRAGTLIGVQGNMLQIKQKSGGGSMEYSVSKSDIAKLEVWTRVQ